MAPSQGRHTGVGASTKLAALPLLQLALTGKVSVGERGKTPPGMRVHTLVHAERGDKERKKDRALRCGRAGEPRAVGRRGGGMSGKAEM